VSKGDMKLSSLNGDNLVNEQALDNSNKEYISKILPELLKGKEKEKVQKAINRIQSSYDECRQMGGYFPSEAFGIALLDCIELPI